MGSRFAFVTGAATHVGKVRAHNEDSLMARPDIGLWTVADGMGGYGGGDIASAAVVAALASLPAPPSAAAFLADFEARIESVNADLRALSATRGTTGTTLASLLIFEAHFACVWCGDSRVYRLRGGVLAQLSRDHSEVQDLVDRGVLNASEARTWPRRNVVTRALGAVDSPELEIVDGPVLAGDHFLLCSDGLTGHVEDAEIGARLGGADPQAICDELVALTLERGATDNVSIVVVFCEPADDRTVLSAAPFLRDPAGRN